MKTTRLAITLVLIAVLAQPQTITGQAVPASVKGDWESLKTAPSGDRLGVELKSRETVKGRLSTVTDTMLTLTRGNRMIEIKRADVLKVHRLIPKSAKTATLIGLGIGAGIGAGIGVGFSRGGESGENYPIVLFGGVGAGLGALAGYLSGRGKRQVLIYDGR